MGNVCIGVELVGQLQLAEFRRDCGNDLLAWPLPFKQLLAEPGKAQLAFALDDVIRLGKIHSQGQMADLWPAQHHEHIRCYLLEHRE